MTKRMAKRTSTRKRTPRKRTGSRASRTSRIVSALKGRGARGKEMVVDIGPAADAAARTTEEKREPRPYTSRYPIPDDRFRKLKDSAVKTKVPKGSMTASADAGGGVEVSSTGVALAAMDPSLEPSAAPTASTNFGGIAATGWIPPDCTMAVGPSHVMLVGQLQRGHPRQGRRRSGPPAHAHAMVLERGERSDDFDPSSSTISTRRAGSSWRSPSGPIRTRASSCSRCPPPPTLSASGATTPSTP